MRTMLGVPLVKEGRLLGSIAVYRREVQPFADAHIALIKTFAEQAGIAIENVRLFKELEARNSELRVALEQQTATSEILRAISSSPTDVQPVFDTIARSAVRLCDASFGTVFQMRGASTDLAAQDSMTEEALEAFARSGPCVRTSKASWAGPCSPARSSRSRMPTSDPNYRYSSVQRAVGYRTIAAVPMVRETQAIGVIVIVAP